MRREDPTPKLDLGSLRRQSVAPYLVRFGFGAGISLVAAVIGLRFGSHVGGMLLAFPAILPASLTLIEHEKGRHEAVVDARGAIIGAIALVVFAVVAGWALSRYTPVLSMAAAGVSWVGLSLVLYAVLVWWPRRPSAGR